MATEEEYPLINGQCGACRFARGFDVASTPSGPNDGVQCTSEDYAKYLDGLNNPQDTADDTFNQFQKELKQYGFMDLWRFEAIAEASYRCHNFKPRD